MRYLIEQCVIRVLREHAEGRAVSPDRLNWAIEMVILNPRLGRAA